MAPDSAIAMRLAERPLQRIPKPWGEELILNRSADAVVKVLRIDPNCRLSLQYHRRKHETLTLLSGAALLTIGSTIERLCRTPMALGVREEVAAGVLHRLGAGDDGAAILEVASRLAGDAEDIVRLDDDYGRVNAVESMERA